MSDLSDKSYKQRRKNIFGSPYTTKESLGWVFRNVFGLSKKNKELLDNVHVLQPGKYVINEKITPNLCIGFVGDIMDMKGYDLLIDESVVEFFSDANFFVGNFEATITEKKASLTSQRHSEKIIHVLKSLFNPKNTFLSVANNHTGDYHRDIFLQSANTLKDEGFQVFGYDDNNYTNINPNIRLLTGSSWSNFKCDYLPCLKDRINPATINNQFFKVLFPHWGYELELYPRKETIEKGKNYLFNQDIDAIIGHHSHCPQPVTIEYLDAEKKIGAKLLVYSLGDFCIGLKMKQYQYGIGLKMWLGNNKESQKFEIHSIEFSYTQCEKINNKEFLVKKISQFR